MGTKVYIYGGTFNFNNPQSSQKSDDSGLQIAKTKYKRIIPLVIPILSELLI